MNESQQVKALLNNFERSTATGSLKAANVSLGKILALIQKQIDAITGTPDERAALSAAMEGLNDRAVAAAMTKAVDERIEEPSSHYDVAQAIVEDPAAITANEVEVPEPEMPEPEVAVVEPKVEPKADVSVEEAPMEAPDEPKAEEKVGDAADEAAEDAPKNRRGRK